MDFPVSIPWETLDPEILQKAINSGSNYRTYCDEKSWDISFEIEFLEKEEIQKQVKVLENQFTEAGSVCNLPECEHKRRTGKNGK